MKRLRSFDAPRQRRWEHDGHTYSIVDLTMMPGNVRRELRKAGPPVAGRFGDKHWSELMEFYRPHQFEIYCFTHSLVVGRFRSFKEAEEAIRREEVLCDE